MWPHLVNLLVRSWDAMVRATGTTTLGFIVWTLALTLIGWVATVAARWLELKRENNISPLRTALLRSGLRGLFIFGGLFVLVVLAFLISTVYTVYNDHHYLVEANKTLRRPTQPQIQLFLDEWGFAERVVGDKGAPLIKQFGTAAVMVATVRNLGPPSIADDWSLSINLPGRTDTLNPGLMDFNFKHPGPIYVGGDIIPFDKLLYRETLTPIATGDKKQGIIAFFVYGMTMKELTQKGTELTLTCHNIAGTAITATAVVTGNNEGHRHFPGLE